MGRQLSHTILMGPIAGEGTDEHMQLEQTFSSCYFLSSKTLRCFVNSRNT
jgi:hypothetical protein